MRSFKGDMMTLIGKVDALCITTNGFIKNNGACVMGRGIAKAVANKYPTIPFVLGGLLKTAGNKVHHLMCIDNTSLISFPVKPTKRMISNVKNDVVAHMQHHFNKGDWVPGWALKADNQIIQDSARQLVEMANKKEWHNIAIPRVGCGAGELNWFDVKSLLDEYLDNRFIECTFK